MSLEADTKIRIVLVGMQKVIRDSLEILFQKGVSDMEIVGQAGRGEVTSGFVGELGGDVVLMGMGIPIIDRVEVSQRIIRGNSDVKILLVSAGLPEAVISQTVCSGFLGLVLENPSFDELVHTIRTVCENGKYLKSEEIGVFAK